MNLVTYHPFVHIVASHCSEVTLRTRFKAMRAFCKAMFYNVCRSRFIYTAMLKGAVSSGAVATITRTILGISMPTLLSNVLNLLLGTFVPWKRPMKRVAEQVGKLGLDPFYSPSKLNFDGAHWGRPILFIIVFEQSTSRVFFGMVMVLYYSCSCK